MDDRYTLDKMKKVWSYENRFRKWLLIELSICRVRHKRGEIPNDAMRDIEQKADFDINRIKEIEAETKHEPIAFLTSVNEFVGPAGRFIHVGVTSSDIMDTGLSMQTLDACEIVRDDLKQIYKTLINLALKYKDQLQMGRSHGVHAEPITFGLKMLLFAEEFKRNMQRFEDAVKMMRVGKISGVVGTFAFLDPELELEALKQIGLEAATVSNQVIQRDRHAQMISTLAVIAGSLDKLAVELRHMVWTEVGEAAEGFTKGQKGSSAMPHKKNPISLENISGLTRIIRANAQAAYENQTLWAERDISHSSVERVIFPDSFILMNYLLNRMNNVLENLVVYGDRMIKNMEHSYGAFFSQRLLLELTAKGWSREDAYPLVQKLAHSAVAEKINFEIKVRESDELKELFTSDEIDDIFDYGYFTRHVNAIFKRAGLNVD
ncbi:adenylosuccinate lyase [bacterium]|nr:adenylosuccinate lyase [bacterium]MBU1024565.1 adenylosuccinate lyase [bacterium]